MQLSIIIVSYNTQKLLKSCLQSLTVSSKNLPIEIIVVDNNSSDRSPQLVQTNFPQIKLIQSQSNSGFGPANNLGAFHARGQYLFFLNSDTTVDSTTLASLLDQINHHQPDIASCKLLNQDGSLQPQGGALPNLINLKLWMANLDHLPGISQLVPPYQNRQPNFFDHNQFPGWVAGTAMIVKASIFNQLNGFDPNIFMYAEDIDLCYRAHQNGFRVVYWPQPAITHLGQGSGSNFNAILGEFKGLRYLFKKHKPEWQGPILSIILKAGALYRTIIFAIIGQHEKSALYKQAFSLG